MSEQIAFPPAAQDRIRNIGAQIEGLQAQLQSFIDGLVVGFGVDVEHNNISVDLTEMTATITPKGEANASPEGEKATAEA